MNDKLYTLDAHANLTRGLVRMASLLHELTSDEDWVRIKDDYGCLLGAIEDKAGDTVKACERMYEACNSNRKQTV